MNPAPAATGSPAPVQPADWAPPPLRGDLVEQPQRYLGRSFVIFKNPLSLGYFRLPAAHAAAAKLFDGKRRLGDIAAELRANSAYWRALPPESAGEELAALATQLASSGLLKVQAPSAGDRARRLREMKKKRRFEIGVGHVLYFKKALFDPDRLLDRIMPWVAWIYAPAVLVAALLFMLASLAAALAHFDQITAYSANFFTLQNLGLTYVLFLGVKVLHEFGHALTCKRFGGEVHEMGFMFILFTPYLFCNVSDSWLATKRQRIAVTSAGILVELFLASAAVWLWLNTQPGLFHQMCFNTMFLCSVSTVLFNANPLMKFDGYYIMADLLEIPNLRAKSNAFVTAWAQRVLLGVRQATRGPANHETGPWFGVYAVAAYAYGWFIVYNISIMMFDMLEPYGLQIFSRTYVALFLFVSLGLPLYRLAVSLRGNPGMVASGMHRLRFIVLLLAALIVAAFFLPWRETISRSAALEHGKIHPVSAPLAGFLREVHVAEGETVREGQVLGRIENRDLEARVADLGLQRESALVRLRAAMADASAEARLSVPVLEKFVSEADEELGFLQTRLESLELRAPAAGIVRTKRPADQTGLHFSAGQTVFVVGEPGPPRLVIALDEQQARRVRVGQEVTARFSALPDRSFHGRISSAPISPGRDFTVPGLANLRGGDVPSETDASGHPVPSVPYFEAEALLDLPPADLARLRAQATGRARITIGQISLARWVHDKTLDLIDPRVRL